MPQTLLAGMHFAIRGKWSNGRPVISSWHAIVTPTGTRALALPEAGARIVDKWFTHVLPVLPDNYSFDGCNWTDLDSVEGATGFAGRAAASGGDISAAGTPPNQGVLVTKTIAGSGRSKRSGRIFLPGNLESLVDENGIVSTGKLTQVETALAAFRTNFNTTAPVGNIATCRLVVAHAPSHIVTQTVSRRVPDPDGALGWDDVTGFAGSTLVSGIRRRVGR